ncbi:hypothetical protein EV175_004216 [Coemansia sp. RSA 1933]|nr:hypothetical protein EV175_004216 [Coemansia sp. RSA 1933]
MSDLLSSSPICTRSKGPRRLARSKCKRGPVLEDNDSLLSSSPPSTPGRLLESGKNSHLFGSRAGSEISDNDSIREHATRTVAVPSSVADVSVTPVAQVGNRQVLDSMQGPSTATSKRLQMRAYTHNVVYTYGRSRDDEDYGLGDGSDALGSELSPTLRLQATFEPTGRLALESTQNDGNQRVAGTLLDLVDPVNRNTSNECEQPMPGGSFKQQISDIIHGLGTASRSADSASSSPCEKLLSKLEDQNFCDDLISSKSRLSALVHALGRIRDDPVVLSTTAVLIAVAFQTPTAMQMLVFEKQILEIVAGILKAVTTGTLPDILALRRRHGFDTPAQYGCAEQICRLAHGHGLLFGGKIPLSSYNLVLCALYGFSRNDDVAFVAMAPLLRNEMHESGCLGLIAERSVALSVPALVKQQSKSSFTGSNIAAARGMVDKGSNPYRQPLLPSDDDSGNNNNDDDEWMDFDLPEETKKAPASFTGKKLKRKATSVTDPTEHNDRSAKVFDLPQYQVSRLSV